MEIIRVNSIILKKLPIKEYDALVFLFTESMGKIIARAKSGFKKNTKWSSIIETMNLIDTSLYKKNEYYYLTETKVLDSYTQIKLNLNKSFVALQILNLIDKTQLEYNPNVNLFRSLINFFNILKINDNYNSLFINFIFNFIKIEGIQFPFESCIKCGKKLNANYFYDVNFNGFVCDTHKTRNFIEIKQNLYEKIIKLNYDSFLDVYLEKEELETIFGIISSFLESYFSFRIKNYIHEILV